MSPRLTSRILGGIGLAVATVGGAGCGFHPQVPVHPNPSPTLAASPSPSLIAQVHSALRFPPTPSRTRLVLSPRGARAAVVETAGSTYRMAWYRRAIPGAPRVQKQPLGAPWPQSDLLETVTVTTYPTSRQAHQTWLRDWATRRPAVVQSPMAWQLPDHRLGQWITGTLTWTQQGWWCVVRGSIRHPLSTVRSADALVRAMVRAPRIAPGRDAGILWLENSPRRLTMTWQRGTDLVVWTRPASRRLTIPWRELAAFAR